jgi:probable HAF family extracellular repeat protein
MLLLGATATTASAGPILYSVIPVAGPNSNAYAINSNGDVTGVYRTSGGADHAFIYTQSGGFLDLGTLLGGNSVGRDINDDGFVVGQTDGTAFKWHSSTGMVGLNAGPSDARGISNSNEAIGTVTGTLDNTTIWLSSNTAFPSFVTENTQGYAIDSGGRYVGRVDGTTGYISDGSSITYTDLGLFLPNDINNAGNVAGSENGIAGLFNANNSTFLPFGKLNPTDDFSDALGLNGLNQFVGISQGTGGFTWTFDDGMVDLSASLAPGFENWSVISANGINDKGWISGTVRFDGQDRAAIIVPVPEPSMMVLAILASPLLLLRRAFRPA